MCKDTKFSDTANDKDDIPTSMYSVKKMKMTSIIYTEKKMKSEKLFCMSVFVILII